MALHISTRILEQQIKKKFLCLVILRHTFCVITLIRIPT